MINTRINKIRQTHEDTTFVGIEEKDGFSVRDLVKCVNDLIASGLSSELIKTDILPNLGFSENSLPLEVKQILK